MSFAVVSQHRRNQPYELGWNRRMFCRECLSVQKTSSARYPSFLHQIMLLERLFFMAAFLLLFRNVGNLFGIDGHQLFIDLTVVREQILILFLLIIFIHRMPETAYRLKVLRWLKFFLFVFTAGSIANFSTVRSPVGRNQRPACATKA